MISSLFPPARSAWPFRRVRIFVLAALCAFSSADDTAAADGNLGKTLDDMCKLCELKLEMHDDLKPQNAAAVTIPASDESPYLTLFCDANRLIIFNTNKELFVDPAGLARRRLVRAGEKLIKAAAERLDADRLLLAMGGSGIPSQTAPFTPYDLRRDGNRFTRVDKNFVLLQGHYEFVKTASEFLGSPLPASEKRQTAPLKTLLAAKPSAAGAPPPNNTAGSPLAPEEGNPVNQVPPDPAAENSGEDSTEERHAAGLVLGPPAVTNIDQAMLLKALNSGMEPMRFHFNYVPVQTRSLSVPFAPAENGVAAVGQVSAAGVYEQFLRMAKALRGLQQQQKVAGGGTPQAAALEAQLDTFKKIAALQDYAARINDSEGTAVYPFFDPATPRNDGFPVRQSANVSAETTKAVAAALVSNLQESDIPPPPAPAPPPDFEVLSPANISHVDWRDLIPATTRVSGFTTILKAPDPLGRQSAGGAAEQVVLFDDPQNNTIVVIDFPEHRPIYEKIHRILDQESALIQIVADIVDVAAGDSFLQTADVAFLDGHNLGGDNRFSTRGFFDGGLKFPGATAGTTNPFATDIANPATPFGAGTTALVTPFSIAAELRGSSSILRARLAAMKGQGLSYSLARPILMTTSGCNAHYQENESILIPGKKDLRADLYRVNAPFALNITPTLLREHGNVHLKIDITDAVRGAGEANQDEPFLSGVPSVLESKIETQAIIAPGESILIGGRIREEIVGQEKRTPVLGRLPVIGNAFKDRTKNKAHLRRYFLITPQVVNTPAPQK